MCKLAVVEQQLKEMTRSYQSALDFYNELLKKSNNSEMAKDLHTSRGRTIPVLDPPSLRISLRSRESRFSWVGGWPSLSYYSSQQFI